MYQTHLPPMLKLLSFLPAALLISSFALGQAQQPVVTYHDDTFTQVKEKYFITSDSAIVGYYHRYYPTGEPEALVKFVEGKKDSVYTEFYPSGQPKLQLTYNQGVKQGPFKAFRPDGKLLQEGYYENDQQSRDRKSVV